MADFGSIKGKKRFAPALLAAASMAIAIPGAGLAVVSESDAAASTVDFGLLPFTPAKADPQLARQVAAVIGAEGLRFTPASKTGRSDRTVTVAVRVDDATARAISVRSAIDGAKVEAGLGNTLAIAPTRYNLGIARGYQSFAQPKPVVSLPAGVRDLSVPDLSEFRTESSNRADKPSRFQPRISLENETGAGRSPRTRESLGEQSVDLGGSYRVVGNLNVTAGVRLSQDRDRLAPLTDGVEDSKAVYVGTQISF